MQLEKYELDKKKEEELFKDAVIIFDTSALLDLYYYSEKARKRIVDNILGKIKKRVWIPAQVEFEFSKNREKVIRKPVQTYKDLLTIRRVDRSSEDNLTNKDDKNNNDNKNNNDSGYMEKLEKLINEIKNQKMKEIIGQINALTERTTDKKVNKHPILEKDLFSNIKAKIEELEKDISGLVGEFKTFKEDFSKSINERIAGINKDAEIDSLFNKIEELFKIGEEFSYDETIEIIKEGEIRYRNSIPPGYKDLKDKIGFQMYGDLICWKQILKYMKDINKPAILVTNDVKEDWFDKSDNIKKPRYELIKEFWSQTNNQFWMYEMSTFLFKIESTLGIKLERFVKDEINSTMDLKFINSIKPKVIREVCRYAKNRSDLHNKYGIAQINSGNAEELERFWEYYKTGKGKLIKEAEKELRDYLHELDFETIKIIQTIMYLGRDGDYNEEDRVDERYSKFRQDLDELGWSKKDIEINQMVNKIPLDKYLIKGLKILGIEFEES
ncbi:PIN-like domain-containing protein [Clostridium sp. WILCCON 0269]|uniref:PIN-like domain-containing protein n=1 Tax=Candidatus Clostridium eludens TaxID=3381663 RepID=A0ABW8SNI2_9CLOT